MVHKTLEDAVIEVVLNCTSYFTSTNHMRHGESVHICESTPRTLNQKTIAVLYNGVA